MFSKKLKTKKQKVPRKFKETKIYEYDIEYASEDLQIFADNFLFSSAFVKIVCNLVIILSLLFIGIGFGILFNQRELKTYKDHCEKTSQCRDSFICQDGLCICSSNQFYNLTSALCTQKKSNLASCNSTDECCCDLKCTNNYCLCPSDKIWYNSDKLCIKRPYYNDSCSSTSDCWLNTNLTCLNSKCICSDANLNFWNGTFCSRVESYLGSCKISSGCNQTQGLVCNLTEQIVYKCVCPSYNYWDLSLKKCITQRNNTQSCTSTDQCRSGTILYCDTSSTNTCICPIDYYWSTNTCVKRISYGKLCSGAFCDTTKLLSCINSYCSCSSNKFWNGTFCVDLITSGINCYNSFTCDSTLGLLCDKTYWQCICPSTHYWTGSECKLKETNGTWCTKTIQCKSDAGLSCISNYCLCQSTYYWSGSQCLPKKTVNTFCTYSYECQTYNGLECIPLLPTGSYCECPTEKFWNTTQCVDKYTLNTPCSYDFECNNILGLLCFGTCRCDYNYFWNGTICVIKNTHGLPCQSDSGCINNLNLVCINNFCSCMPLMYWSTSKCEFKKSINQSCSGLNPACQNYARLSCTSNNICECDTTEYWVQNKCQKPVGINQYCNLTTYRCKANLECQETIENNSICQCPSGSYWTGSTCSPIKTYNQSCDAWNIPCDYTKNFKCLQDGSGTSCLTSYSGFRCTCISTEYLSAGSCGNVTDLKCVCEKTKFWNGSQCVDKKTFGITCNNQCQCISSLICYVTCNCGPNAFYQNSTQTCVQCPPGFTINGLYPYFCYKSSTPDKFVDSKNSCAPGYLARPLTATERSIVSTYTSSEIWVDVYVSSGIYFWGNGISTGISASGSDTLTYNPSSGSFGDVNPSASRNTVCQFG
ncbi:unnamed protein product [Brachionus calyciflorus]|uniref:EGF-like domain-containing protein n=1 Tax=Brachionus calyciflorus TaxID=104777 RepID=A0A814C250_9BILA|nr:unnamed protein product [Brachionus calyciflorus]